MPTMPMLMSSLNFFFWSLRFLRCTYTLSAPEPSGKGGGGWGNAGFIYDLPWVDKIQGESCLMDILLIFIFDLRRRHSPF